MRAARDFADRIEKAGLLAGVARVSCVLYGSLGATGIGHGTPDAIVAGLAGLEPETVDPAEVRDRWQSWNDGASLALAGVRPITFVKSDIRFAPLTRLPGHPN